MPTPQATTSYCLNPELLTTCAFFVPVKVCRQCETKPQLAGRMGLCSECWSRARTNAEDRLNRRVVRDAWGRR